MLRIMDIQPRIVIADRSELAANMYRLLLMPTGASLVVRRRFEEARPHFFRRENVKLAIFNSNIFGKKFAEILKRLVEDEPMRKVQKIFLCRDIPAELPWSERLGALPNSKAIVRPFHPDELLSMVEKLIQ